jgi:phosphoribosylformimino-5-aminoimidazole carboxamide ribotide isomerase
VLKRYHGEVGDATFDILPAIDVLGGKVVRLRQGRFDDTTTFSADPAAVAARFAEQGATMIHVVDLDGAREGTPIQSPTIARVIGAVGEGVAVQVAGGLRTDEAIRSAFDIGARRVVLGTAAIRTPALASRAVDQFGTEAVVVAVDVRDDRAVGDGWRKGAAGLSPEVVVESLAEAGIRRFAVTAIDRDGLMRGPDLGLLERIVALDRGAIIASGGISSIDDLRAVKQIGCRGAIVGRAMYEGKLDLPAAYAWLTPGGRVSFQR